MFSDHDCNYREELVKSFISESNGGISVFIACTSNLFASQIGEIGNLSSKTLRLPHQSDSIYTG